MRTKILENLVRTVPKNDPAEDTGLVFAADGSTFGAVADGVGGNGHGDVASRCVVDEVRHAFEERPEAGMAEVFQRAKARLTRESAAFKGMATTLTVVRLANNRIDIGHVGDCRAYLLRGNGLKTLTTDQNEAQYLFEQGVLDKKEAARYPRRNVLLSAISADQDYDLYTYNEDVISGDRILILSDGTYSVISKKEIVEANLSSERPEVFVGKLYDLLRDRGVRDDATLACLTA